MQNLYNLRSAHKFVNTECRHACFKNSATTLYWNNLDLSFQAARSFYEFKSSIERFKLLSKPNKHYFLINTPYVKYHIQLKSELSGLRACLQSLLSPETTKHYLLKCHTHCPPPPSPKDLVYSVI